MAKSLADYNTIFFIGVAGVGMSALAQYLAGTGKQVSGSDRYFSAGAAKDIREKLETAGISCFAQNGEGITQATSLVVVSTAIEDTVPEVQKARELGIPILRRSELLALIAASKKTIAVAGTSGKSTTSAMLFDILEGAGWQPSIISGAGLVSIIEQGKIGNAKVGQGEWLVIEADESDGSIVQYHPEVGLLLNVDKDHQEIEELMQLFTSFRSNSKSFFVNRSNPLAAQLSNNAANDFAVEENTGAQFVAADFVQDGFTIHFSLNGNPYTVKAPGRHSMENALAAIAVASQLGVEPAVCAAALENYKGIYRRHQLLGVKKGVTVIDDYAHNPVKCARSIEACQPLGKKVVAWFQPHGYGPTRFLRNDFVKEIAAALRPQDEIWMTEIFYAGGTAVKDISANDLILDIRAKGKQAFFIENRNDLLTAMQPHLDEGTVVLLMGARDPSLEQFGKDFFQAL